MLTAAVAIGSAPVIRLAGALLVIGAAAFTAALARVLTHLLPWGRSLATVDGAPR